MKDVIGITGATGNLGRKFCKLYKKNFIIKKFNGDIRKEKDITKWLRSANFKSIFHFAAIVPVVEVEKNYLKALSVNHLGTKNLISYIKKYNANLEWFFYSSTSHVYAPSELPISETFKLNPISKYGKSKLLGENEIIKKLKKSEIKYTIGRIFSISDNKDKSFFLNNLKRKLKTKKKVVTLGDLNHYRDFLITDQICNIIFKLYKKKYSGIINIGSGKKTFLKKIALEFSKDKKKKIIFDINKKKEKTCLVANISKLNKALK